MSKEAESLFEKIHAPLMLIAHSQLPRYGNNPSVHQEMMVEEIVTHTDTHSGALLSHKEEQRLAV